MQFYTIKLKIETMKRGIQILALLILTTFNISQAQTNYTIKDAPSIKINGTSTLHNWEMESSTATCNATFVLNASNQITGITAIHFSTPVEQLKSGKGAMDKNAYKALNKDKYPAITFELTPGTATITPKGGGVFTVKGYGKLSFGGGIRDIELLADCKVNADKTITVTGTRNIGMKDYGVKPPSFMMGAVKTGNEIVLNFSLNMK
jgi:polyisoprenoid-binding protein YceI